jgi:uncharacterized protein (UPF0335 family)
VGERDRLAVLDRRITALEEEIAEEYAALRDEGFDPAAARAAIRKRNQRLTAVRKERETLLRFRSRNIAAAGIATRLRAIAAQAEAALDEADLAMQRRVLELLRLRVSVTGWERCLTCEGRGLVVAPHPTRRLGNTGAMCPDCRRTRHVPRIRITGQVPELLLITLAAPGNVDLLPNKEGAMLHFRGDVLVA